VFWPSTIPEAGSGLPVRQVRVMHDRMDALSVLKGGGSKESAWKCKDALRKTIPVENQSEPN
jgi:hypothetical protein